MIDPRQYTPEMLRRLITETLIEACLINMRYKSTEGSETVNEMALSSLDKESTLLQVVYPPTVKISDPKLLFSFYMNGTQYSVPGDMSVEGMSNMIIGVCNRLILGHDTPNLVLGDSTTKDVVNG